MSERSEVIMSTESVPARTLGFSHLAEAVTR